MAVFFIAEAGVNHNGDYALAIKLVDAAIEAGADAVKFQTFKAESLLKENTPKAEYQKETTNDLETQFEMIKKLELSYDQFRLINDYCIKKGILFLSSAFDLDSIQFLSDIRMSLFKIPSGEITNFPYLKMIGSVAQKAILSTGMATIAEIEAAIDVLETYGLSRDKITVLHCNSEYPTPMKDVNLQAMVNIGKTFGVQYGYSDHTEGSEVAVAAVALGAVVIEKHFTLDKDMEGPDHKASVNPEELKDIIEKIRNLVVALGDGVKRPTDSEVKNKLIARKSIVAKRAIKEGDIFSAENLTVKRPGTGISPMEWNNVLGQIASKNLGKGELIILDCLQSKWV